MTIAASPAWQWVAISSSAGVACSLQRRFDCAQVDVSGEDVADAPLAGVTAFEQKRTQTGRLKGSAPSSPAGYVLPKASTTPTHTPNCWRKSAPRLCSTGSVIRRFQSIMAGAINFGEH